MAESEEVKRLPKVPENLLKKRKAYQAIKETQKKRNLQQRKGSKTERKIKFKRAEQFLRDSRKKQRDDVRLRRLECKPGPHLTPPAEPRLVFAVRVRSSNACSYKAQRCLQLLRLSRIFSGVFIKLGKTSLHMLRQVEPFIAWGYPNLKSVRELILKRGQTKVNGKLCPLTDNAMIEDRLGKHGMVCLEDVIHEIFTLGKNFRTAAFFLQPMILSVARHSRLSKGGQESETGPTGDRGDDINQLIRQLN
ncbi:large ribosomal subunit protein uL30-like [Petromyzon marinus]|uniref:60S ribosomal protein L7-like 1 isoform X1 n=1 Tax=Petromyzon marinus TaxID=7757 RepID=A0AAJ7TYA8_PETMA|nr:60S ribosomal protein L7-like 1 isoform X1 [Petromyzon marinus]